ncbi:MAG: homocysteine S-methyltransferase family protein [Deferribacterales bacterium]|nr:homocysteine S-methyltransferase family protein [Deferribacterales bacterium]
MFRDFSEKNIVLFDGAMGTAIQKINPDNSIWQGKNGCNEFLNLSAPDIICDIHREYFAAGADVAVTNTFGAISSVLSEYGLQDKVAEINKSAVNIARKAAQGFENKFVALSLGPGTKLASLGHTTYDELYSQYLQQAEAGIEADLFIVETSQYIIQIKAAVNACHHAARNYSKDMPIIVSFTVEQNNALLTGSDISAIAAVIRGLDVYALGLNCAMGPDMMKAPLQKLTQHWGGRLYLSPNAGLPETIDGKTIYPMDADKFGAVMGEILSEFPISITGGCCGTDYTHIKAVRNVIDSESQRVNCASSYDYTGEAASLYTAQSLTQSPAPAIIGERANATGSKAFREMLLADDIDGINALCKHQEETGAHFIDLSLAYAGRNEADDYSKIVPILNSSLTTPLVIDSTDPEVVLAAIKRYSGKPIINSVNLEDGGVKMRRMLDIVKDHPACMVALTIDEKGMAQTSAEKAAIACRLYKIWVEEYGFPPQDLIIDALTFSVGSGDETLRNSAAETIDAIKVIKTTLSGVKTVLGVSNVSFGLSAQSRPALNSVFLSEAVKAGLDVAIVHPSKLIAVSSLSDHDLNHCLDLVYGREGSLAKFISHFASYSVEPVEEDVSLTAEEALRSKIIKGDKASLKDIIDKVAENMAAEDIINNLLFPAMQEVGELFGQGKMLLPFVLQSAEAMKTAVSILEPRLKKSDSASKGDIVLATVQGDVHDIGKNLVDIIMSNNGYKVYNLGIKVPVSEMIEKALETKASAIGMSGLLVKSTQIMKENIDEISKRIPHIKIMLGGAALTEKFVKESCAPLMPGKVFYCRDAFDNISVMDGSRKPVQESLGTMINDSKQNNDKPTITLSSADIPMAPFFGTKVVENINIEDVFEYLNKASLFTSSWGYKRKTDNDKEYDEMLKKIIFPEFNALKNRIINDCAIEPKAIYGYFRAKKNGDCVKIYNENSPYHITSFRFPVRKTAPYITIADYFSDSDDIIDIMPMQIVTLGTKPVEYCRQLFKGDNYKDYFMLHGLFTELADALAELIHRKIRMELKIDTQDAKTMDGILSGKYRGKRYSFGYPMAPETEHNKTVAGLLGASRIGVEINDTYQMVPEYTTSAVIVHHPDAIY